ncbi:CHAT domain-containing protein [Hassallia byssoidea VB512170]|uniref:CHAT domain-containing protein n=1 Tax=Hassallia byssoidea VB512170 TaxID=1304833 RepID=A0A846GYE3_9CYAN|nr:CVNH domain-containing protein [Hassalia byssoidea]NEU71057.1 CHAT domain-containing protein [Hassalia byssoidea VB512170]
MNIDTPAKKILILAANPKQTSRLRLDEEVRDIKEGLRLSQQRDKFILQQEWAVRPRDVRRAVLDFRPNIIHFSGHGAGTTGLSFEDEIGKEKLVTGEALAGLFGQFAKQVECVVLNACYSEEQAVAIAQHIDYVIGMNAAIGDKAALEFAVGFYDALVAYDPRYDTYSRIEFAFNIACNAIQFAGISGDSIPIMKKKPHLGKVEEQPANLVEESQLSNDMSVRQNLSQEDIASIEAIISNKQSTSTNENEPNSLDESPLSSNTATFSQNQKQSVAQTSAPTNRLSNSTSVLRNKKSLIGAGIAAVVALTSYFVFNSQPSLKGTSTPTTSSSPQARDNSSYQKSCRNISINGDELSATCPQSNGSYKQTSIRVLGIENSNGELKYYPNPRTASTYQGSCHNISISGDTLSATCTQGNGSHKQTSIRILGISNNEGNLSY